MVCLMSKQHEDRDEEVERSRRILKIWGEKKCQSQRGEAQMCLSVCMFVCTHPDWQTIQHEWRDLTLTDSGFVHYHTTLLSISFSQQSQVSENQKAVEQPCRQEKIKYVTVIAKHHILGFWRHNKQAHWTKQGLDTATTVKKRGYYYSPSFALFHSNGAESMWQG